MDPSISLGFVNNYCVLAIVRVHDDSVVILRVSNEGSYREKLLAIGPGATELKAAGFGQYVDRAKSIDRVTLTETSGFECRPGWLAAVIAPTAPPPPLVPLLPESEAEPSAQKGLLSEINGARDPMPPKAEPSPGVSAPIPFREKKLGSVQSRRQSVVVAFLLFAVVACTVYYSITEQRLISVAPDKVSEPPSIPPPLSNAVVVAAPAGAQRSTIQRTSLELSGSVEDLFSKALLGDTDSRKMLEQRELENDAVAAFKLGELDRLKVPSSKIHLNDAAIHFLNAARGRNRDGYKALERLASNGLSRAWFFRGTCFEKGWVVSRSLANAVNCYVVAAGAGDEGGFGALCGIAEKGEDDRAINWVASLGHNNTNWVQRAASALRIAATNGSTNAAAKVLRARATADAKASSPKVKGTWHLTPTMTITAKAAGRSVAAAVTDPDRRITWNTPIRLILEPQKVYRLNVSCTDTGRNWRPVTLRFTANWAGPTNQIIEFTEASTYRVLPGDTLPIIALEVYDDAARWKDIHSANVDILGSSPKVKVGQLLVIP